MHCKQMKHRIFLTCCLPGLNEFRLTKKLGGRLLPGLAQKVTLAFAFRVFCVVVESGLC